MNYKSLSDLDYCTDETAKLHMLDKFCDVLEKLIDRSKKKQVCLCFAVTKMYWWNREAIERNPFVLNSIIYAKMLTKFKKDKFALSKNKKGRWIVKQIV